MKFQLALDDSVHRALGVSARATASSPILARLQSAPLNLEAGKTLPTARRGPGVVRRRATSTSSGRRRRRSLEGDAVKAAQQADAVVMFLGLTARLEGEEMSVQVDGFRGGDRTRIDLPAAQQRLLERIVAVGKPTVLVLLNGSAVAVNWAQDRVPAILEAWYPGQAGGSAIADVLFGDYNPAGRLPVTFYRDVADIPPFDDYRMAGRTYRFFKGTPLYPFGHGLSYTTFAYKDLTHDERDATRRTEASRCKWA